MDTTHAPKVEYGVTPTDVMASMSGLDFVRAIFEGRLPAPPIMANVEPFDSAAEPPRPKRASPMPRAACWRTPPRPAWCSRFPKVAGTQGPDFGLISTYG